MTKDYVPKNRSLFRLGEYDPGDHSQQELLSSVALSC
jgi:hypothetical protein